MESKGKGKKEKQKGRFGRNRKQKIEDRKPELRWILFMKRIKRRKRSNYIKHLVSGFLILVAGFTVAYRGYKTKQVFLEYQSQSKELDLKIEEEKKRTEEIKEYRDYVTTDEYIEEIARDKLGLVYNDEVLLKAKEDDK